jgi:hypothetical protein
VRPELVAFRELDTLVRNLTDQLAGFRRRALAAEARSRELEQAAERAQATLNMLRAEATSAVSAREQALAAARDAAERERVAHELLARATAAADARAGTEGDDTVFPAVATANDEPPVPARPPVDLDVAADILRENEMLRTKLAEAKARTAQLVARVRFLRQQLGQGAER